MEGNVSSQVYSIPEIPADSEVRRAGLDQHRFGDWRVVWTVRSDCFIAGPSCVHLDKRGRACSEAMYGPHAWADPVWKRQARRPVLELPGDHTSIVSRWNDGRNYYHWFMDGLTRLIHLAEFPGECRIIVPRNLPSFASRSLELLALNHRVIGISGEDLRIGRYWFAGPTMLSGCPDPLGVAWLRDRLLPPRSEPPKRKLYIERNAPTRSPVNAAEVRDHFLGRGWEVVDPSQHSLDEQIRMFQGAAAVVGVHGAGLTNLLWASPGTKVIELMPGNRRNGCYAGISLVIGLEHHCLICPSDAHANILIPLPALDSLLSALDFERLR